MSEQRAQAGHPPPPEMVHEGGLKDSTSEGTRGERSTQSVFKADCL